MEPEQWFESAEAGGDDRDDGRYSHLRSPPVRVPVHHQNFGSPEPRRSKKPFGAMHRQSQYPQRDSYRQAQGYDSRSSNSAGFERVVSSVAGRHVGRRRMSYSMQEDEDFRFGDERDQRYQRDDHHQQQHQQHNHYMHPNHQQHEQQHQQHEHHHQQHEQQHQQQQHHYQQYPPPQQHQGEHAQPKYNSSNARTTGQRISRPGASIMSNNEETVLLTQRVNPPKEQDSFLGGIMRAKKKFPPARVTLKRPMALEQASAPRSRSPHEVVSSPSEVDSPVRTKPTWTSTRPPGLQKKPRILLTPSKAPSPLPSAASRVPVRSSTRQSLSRNTSLESASSSVGHPMLQNNRRRSLNSFQAASYDVEPLKARTRAPSKRLEKKKASKFGTADQPIDLDSDSDQGTESKSKADNAPDTGPGIDVESMKNDCIAQIDKCEAWIGQFPCCADLIFMVDCMWIYNISGKLRAWPFTKTFKILYRTVKEIQWNPEYSEKPDDTQDLAEKLISETSFMAFKAPFMSPSERLEVKSVYDPHGSDSSKQFLVIRSLQDDREGVTFGQIEDSLRAKCKAAVNLVSDRLDGKIYLQGMLVKSEPIPESRTRSSDRKRTRNTEDLRSGEESDEENGDSCMIQFTYPLPPCSTDLVAITRGDISRLKPRHYLNDNIIDYFFKRLMLEDFRSSPFIQKNVLFMSSHFYSRLRMGKGDKLSERLQSGYNNVATWFTNTNIFDRSLIFIPINKDMHWSIAVIVNPRLAAKETDSEDDSISCIAILDPLGGYHSKAAIMRHLKAFLKFEWSKPSNNEVDEALPYNPDNVLAVNVPIPHQENSFDCGVYILKFAEVMIRNYETLASSNEDDSASKDDCPGTIPMNVIEDKLEALISSRAFTADDVARQRKQIEETIASDTAQYQLAMEQKKDQKQTSEDLKSSDEKETKAADRNEEKGTETESDENMKDCDQGAKEAAVGDTTEDEEQHPLGSKVEHSKPESDALEAKSRKKGEEEETEDEAGDGKEEVSETETMVVDLEDDEDEEDVILTIEVDHQTDNVDHEAEDVEC